MIQKILDKYPEYRDTCGIYDLKDKAFTFIRDKTWELEATKDVVILVPTGTEGLNPKNTYEFVDNLDYTFTLLHNEIHKDTEPAANVIGENCFIHPTAIIGTEGMHVAKAPDGSRVQMKHVGNVILEDNVSVFAFTTVDRGVFGSTIIGASTKLDSHVSIGHNCKIGKNCVMTAGTIIAGSVVMGDNCMTGIGTRIRNYMTISKNVIIGAGSVVVKNLDAPGMYVGVPAKLFSQFKSDWNF